MIIKDSDKVVSWMGWDMRGRGDERSDERSRRYSYLIIGDSKMKMTSGNHACNVTINYLYPHFLD